MMRKCHLNTCPVGVATQDANLRKRFIGDPAYLENYFRFIAREVREILAETGVRKFDEIVGRTDLLEKRTDIQHWKARHVDISNMIYFPPEAKMHPLFCQQSQDHKISDILDTELIRLSGKAISNGEKVWISRQIKNTDRATGTMLSGEITSKNFHRQYWMRTP
jgi:glutamate synthase (NADPH) large chain